MYELNASQINFVSGGNLIYVTEQWKHDEAMFSAQVMGIVIAGAFLCCCIVDGTSGIATASYVLSSGVLGGGMTYALSRLENMNLTNDTWYYA
jgi:hypothetical protein